mmetsp:Transcript_8553/g.24577  ORF Transcript_8553/g.24577 Transcript_8553/m.24577 type:complete len:97 (+) Transcript_8553:771-1061(+)
MCGQCGDEDLRHSRLLIGGATSSLAGFAWAFLFAAAALRASIAEQTMSTETADVEMGGRGSSGSLVRHVCYAALGSGSLVQHCLWTPTHLGRKSLI